MGDRGGVQRPWVREVDADLEYPTIHPSSGHTPDVSVRLLPGVCSDKILSLTPWSLPNWRKEGVTLRHLAS